MNRYLEDNFAPVPDEISVADLEVTGQVPPELSGRYVRIGPNPVGADPETYHWFVGEGMVHGVRLDGGRAAWYRNRWVRNGAVNSHLGTPPTPGPTGPGFDASPNTNIIQHAGQTLALVEAGGLPMVLDDDLDTITRSDYDGTLPDAYTAHPKRDPRTGELHAVTYYWEHPGVRYLVAGTDGKVNHRVDIDLGASVMVHDCALTASSVLLFDLPCVFDLDLAVQGRFPYIWSHQRAARVGVLARGGAAADVAWVEIDPCYVFHPMNAYDLPDGRVVVDVPRHPSMFDSTRNGPDEGQVRFERWTLDPVAGIAKTEVVDDTGFEFPRIDERLLGGQHRYGYGITAGPHLEFGSVVRHDLVTGERVARADTDRYAWGEVVFVPRHDGAEEADGWLMGFRYDKQSDASDLVILDAAEVAGSTVAEVHIPRRVPFGFHGNWLPDS